MVKELPGGEQFARFSQNLSCGEVFQLTCDALVVLPMHANTTRFAHVDSSPPVKAGARAFFTYIIEREGNCQSEKEKKQKAVHEFKGK